MFFNQHSYVLSALFLIGLVAALALRQGVTAGGVAAVGVTAAALLGVWMLTRTGPSSYDDVAEVEAALAGGQPTLVEFYSNY